MKRGYGYSDGYRNRNYGGGSAYGSGYGYGGKGYERPGAQDPPTIPDGMDMEQPQVHGDEDSEGSDTVAEAICDMINMRWLLRTATQPMNMDPGTVISSSPYWNHNLTKEDKDTYMSLFQNIQENVPQDALMDWLFNTRHLKASGTPGPSDPAQAGGTDAIVDARRTTDVELQQSDNLH